MAKINVTIQLSTAHNASHCSLWKVRGGSAPSPSPVFDSNLSGEQALRPGFDSNTGEAEWLQINEIKSPSGGDRPAGMRISRNQEGKEVGLCFVELLPFMYNKPETNSYMSLYEKTES